MPAFSVDSDAVLTAQAATRSTSERLRTDVAAMLANLTNLQGSWTGSASAAFQSTIEQWRATQRQVEDSLDGINLALESSGRSYADTEQSVIGMFR